MTPSETLREALIDLDIALTGNSRAVAAHMARGQTGLFDEPDRFLTSDGYYLSDGGYSRVLYDDETSTFRPASVSRPTVKLRWNAPEAQEASARASDALSGILRDMDASSPSVR